MGRFQESLQQNSSHFVKHEITKSQSDLMTQMNENHSLLLDKYNDNKEDVGISEKAVSRNIFETHPTLETIQQQYEFTSGHQNNFGIPIEEDERMINFLKAKNKVKIKEKQIMKLKLIINKSIEKENITIINNRITP